MFYTATVLQVVARHEDLLAQATGIESLEGKESLHIVTSWMCTSALKGSHSYLFISVGYTDQLLEISNQL